jgi:hypothetical protein
MLPASKNGEESGRTLQNVPFLFEEKMKEMKRYSYFSHHT